MFSGVKWRCRRTVDSSVMKLRNLGYFKSPPELENECKTAEDCNLEAVNCGGRVEKTPESAASEIVDRREMQKALAIAMNKNGGREKVKEFSGERRSDCDL
ncbi:hypothetical protein FXO37_16824 [Capsicum annuum]|nr:hypothetical protein FXO37_16824 [Capsicum annuum]